MTSPTASRIRTLNWIAFGIGILLTALAIYELVQGERSTSVWIAVVCWPIVATLSAVQLFKSRPNS
ncbi:hypothetical protein CHR55_19315 [Rhodococcus qingshengii]|uniref:Uncharacterized protein n=1 Tax=Rhodococcus qingshengii TaxID=334542 RepID=A0A2A5J7V5_RHOSG|nr:hypothetical protein CHR55_19315 [Rhodococcus qingshengii]